MKSEKEINGIKYKLSHCNWQTGIQANSLHIDIKKDNNQFYEEIVGKAEFIQNLSFFYLNELGETYFGSNDIDLEIRKSNISLEESAKSNFQSYLTPDENVNDYGLSDCIKNGFCHLSIYSKRTKCILILEDNTFERLLSLIKSNSLRSFSFASDYLCIYTEEHSYLTNLADRNQNIYLIKSEGAGYPESTFGAISDLCITTNDWSLNPTNYQATRDDFLISTETQKQISSQLVILSNVILYGFIATIILLILMIVF